MDIGIEPENSVKAKEEASLPARTHQEEKTRLHGDTKMTEISTSKEYERTSEIKEKTETKVIGVRVQVSQGQERENKTAADTTNNVKSREPATTGRQVAAPVEGTETTNGHSKSRIVTKEHMQQKITTSKLSETITPPSCPPPRSPTAGRRQLPADPPARLLQQRTKENTTSSHTVQGVSEQNVQRTAAAKPLSELSSNVNTKQQPVAAPKSSKARAAPPVPLPRSSGSTSAPVPVPRSSGSTSGRSQAPPSDTSGYPDSFSKRKSRDSQEITGAALNQLGTSMFLCLLS